MMDIYTPIEEAKEEVRRRWNDQALRKKVEDFLCNANILKLFEKEPKAILCRNMISPDLEFQHFLYLAKMIQLNPLLLEYPEDRFVNKNSDKYYGSSGLSVLFK